MAQVTYVVKRGDSLWKICSSKEWGPKISGSTVQAKINTVVALNNISNPNLIITGDTLILSKSGGSTSSSSSSTSSTADWRQVNDIKMGLQSANETDSKNRAVCAQWSYSRTHLAKFKYQWYQYINNKWVFVEEKETESYYPAYCYSTFSADANATAVRFRIVPISATYKDKNKNDVYYFKTGTGTNDARWSRYVEYNFSNNPPLTPEEPNVVIDNEKLVLTASISNIVASDLDAVSVKFNIVRDNSVNIHTSNPVSINTTSNYVAYQYTVEPGHTYTVRCCSVGKNNKVSGWSDFADAAGTKPSAPTILPANCRRVKRTDGSISACLEWEAIANATSYKVQYVTVESDFVNLTEEDIPSKSTGDSRTSITITGIAAGSDYFFRVRAVNEHGESDPSAVVKIAIGSTPAAPTTWMSSDSAFVGGDMELNWIHNPTDNSKQTYAQIKLNINDGGWTDGFILTNTTDENSIGEQIDECNKWTYGYGISYKGNLRFKIDTSHADLKNAKVQWKVITAGVTDEFSTKDEDWSVVRTFYIYENPTLGLSMTSDLAGTGNIITTLTALPFYIRGQISLGDISVPYKDNYVKTEDTIDAVECTAIEDVYTSTDEQVYSYTDAEGIEKYCCIVDETYYAVNVISNYIIQRPVGYHLQIIANEHYVTVDDIGQTKTVNPGDPVYSKYFDTSDTLIVEMSANNIDLESGIGYSVYCSVDMSTGLNVNNQLNPHDFTVSWNDVEYTINADISVDEEAYTALITPYCTDANDNPVENVTLAVYRREYDGSYQEVASGIPNNGTSVTDPHPSLDYARYRLVAKDKTTGAISFYDMAGLPVNGSAVILQWAEEWQTFDINDETSAEGPSWTGSLLKLRYNIKVTDSRKREVTLVEYAGREHPVSYYGTQTGEASNWNMEIPADDKETIYALRRLSLWAGDVYVREPSGMGFWASVDVQFNKSYDDVKIPITLNVTRVEGGV